MKTSVKKIIFILFSLFIAISVQAQAGKVVSFSGRVVSAQTQDPLESATLQLYSEKGVFFGTTTDVKGIFRVKIPTGKYRVTVSYIGYNSLTRNIELVRNDSVTYHLALSTENLDEVIVTATEAKGSSSTTKIDREAMQHRQPTSFGDLLSLLPGGMSAVPAIGSASLIILRQAGQEKTMTSVPWGPLSLSTAIVWQRMPICKKSSRYPVPVQTVTAHWNLPIAE